MPSSDGLVEGNQIIAPEHVFEVVLVADSVELVAHPVLALSVAFVIKKDVCQSAVDFLDEGDEDGLLHVIAHCLFWHLNPVLVEVSPEISVLLHEFLDVFEFFTCSLSDIRVSSDALGTDLNCCKVIRGSDSKDVAARETFCQV